MENEPEQEALFELQGLDGDGCVWICSPEGRDVWCHNLGHWKHVADATSEFLDSLWRR